MSERDGYESGVPCWVDTMQPDPEAATAFYGGVFGWDFEGPADMPGGGSYYVARLRGRDVAGIGSQPPGAPTGWNPYMWVESADEAAGKARAAGGAVVAEPFDAPPAGRMAVLADPAGAAFCVWEPGARRGAQVVNEPGAWSMSVLHARDPGTSARFYGDVFGWTTEAFGPFTMFRQPGYVGGEPEQPVSREVIATMAPSEETTAWGADFWVHDVDAAAAKATELGGAVVSPPAANPVGRSAVLADPSGTTFSVSRVVP
jgi:uncharacterized protein